MSAQPVCGSLLTASLKRQEGGFKHLHPSVLKCRTQLPCEENSPLTPPASDTPRNGTPKTFAFTDNSKTQVLEGFGPFVGPGKPAVLIEQHKFFPPMSNARYDLTRFAIPTSTYPRLPKGFDAIAFLTQQLKDDQARDVEALKPTPPTVGQIASQQIDWDTKLYYVGDIVEANLGDTTLKSGDQTLSLSIDKALAEGSNPFVYCGKCSKRHIIPGPVRALPECDTCLSMLPEWFPAYRFANPWEAFIELMNDYVRMKEVRSGHLRDPEGTGWYKEYHDPTPEWRRVGKQGGWWKCRTGLEMVNGKRDQVPGVERGCKLCHGDMTQEEEEELLKRTDLRRREWLIHEWIEDHVRKGMARDREVVEARWKAERKGCDWGVDWTA